MKKLLSVLIIVSLYFIGEYAFAQDEYNFRKIDQATLYWSIQAPDLTYKSVTYSNRNDDEIYIFDLATNNKQQITNDGFRDEWSSFYDNGIIWLRKQPQDTYHFYKWSEGNPVQEFSILPQGAYVNSYRVDGDRIAWEGLAGPSNEYRSEIYFYDPIIGTVQITDWNTQGFSRTWVPDISGDNVVYYEAFRDATVIYNISDGSYRDLNISLAGFNTAAISGNNLIISGKVNPEDNVDVFLYNLLDDTYAKIGDYGTSVDIDGNIITWKDEAANKLMIYNIATGNKSQYNYTLPAGARIFDKNIAFYSSDGNVYLASPVPEPSTMLLFGFSLLGAGLFKRRRK